MPSDRIELVRSLYPPEGLDFVALAKTREAERLIRDASAEKLHPEIRFTWAGGSAAPPLLGRPDGEFESLEEWLGAYRDFVSEFSEWRLRVLALYEIGDAVLVRAMITARSLRADLALEQEAAAVYEFEDGLVRRIREYARLDEALEELGVARDTLPDPQPEGA